MRSLVQSLDIALFRLINVSGQNSFFDWFMPFMSDLSNFYVALLLLAALVVMRNWKAGLVFLVFLGATLALTDTSSNRILKEWIGRIRPCAVLEDIRLITDCNTSYSFPSIHAVNVFAGAFFFSQVFRGRMAPVFYAIAAMVAYSRVYLGIHYPLDVVGGAAIGLLMAWPMRRLKDRVVNHYQW